MKREEKIVQVKARLFAKDYARVQKLAEKDGVPFSTRFRGVLHAFLHPPPKPEKTYIWKFLVPGNEPQPLLNNPMLSVDNHMACAMAPTEDEAREIIINFGVHAGQDMRWMQKGVVKRIERLEIVPSMFVCMMTL